MVQSELPLLLVGHLSCCAGLELNVKDSAEGVEFRFSFVQLTQELTPHGLHVDLISNQLFNQVSNWEASIS